MQKRQLWLVAFVLLFTCASSADTLTLRDGTRYTGVFIDGTSRDITFEDQNGVRRRYDTRDVRSIDFQQTFSGNTVGSSGTNSSRAVGAVEGRVIPAGAELSVRTNQEINTRSAAEGRTYPATIDRDVMDSTGAVLIPRGSDAQLVVRAVQEGGTVKSGEIALDIDSVTINGRRYLVSTADVERSDPRGLGRNRRTAEMVGGGAVLGTVIGAIAGGGKGAIIGAIAGAAAGGAAQVLTKGKEVKVPAETVLTFRLDQPLQLAPARR